MSTLGLLLPGTHLLVGLENDEDGSLRVYLGARHTGIHTHVADDTAVERVRDAWARGGHVTVEVPRDALCDCPAPERSTP